jgi:HNH endonuclease
MSLALDPSMRKMFPPEVIFQFYYDADVPGCWQWKGVKTGKGYGMFYVEPGRNGQRVLAHRFQYEMPYGPIPEGMQIDHLCRNHGCVNPSHLEVVTPQENVLRGEGLSAANARKTHCPQGHAYSGDNLVVRRGKRERRERDCRTCAKARNRRWRAACRQQTNSNLEDSRRTARA